MAREADEDEDGVAPAATAVGEAVAAVAAVAAAAPEAVPASPAATAATPAAAPAGAPAVPAARVAAPQAFAAPPPVRAAASRFGEITPAFADTFGASVTVGLQFASRRAEARAVARASRRGLDANPRAVLPAAIPTVRALPTSRLTAVLATRDRDPG